MARRSHFGGVSYTGMMTEMRGRRARALSRRSACSAVRSACWDRNSSQASTRDVGRAGDEGDARATGVGCGGGTKPSSAAIAARRWRNFARSCNVAVHQPIFAAPRSARRTGCGTNRAPRRNGSRARQIVEDRMPSSSARKVATSPSDARWDMSAASSAAA